MIAGLVAFKGIKFVSKVLSQHIHKNWAKLQTSIE